MWGEAEEGRQPHSRLVIWPPGGDWECPLGSWKLGGQEGLQAPPARFHLAVSARTVRICAEGLPQSEGQGPGAAERPGVTRYSSSDTRLLELFCKAC